MLRSEPCHHLGLLAGRSLATVALIKDEKMLAALVHLKVRPSSFLVVDPTPYDTRLLELDVPCWANGQRANNVGLESQCAGYREGGETFTRAGLTAIESRTVRFDYGKQCAGVLDLVGVQADHRGFSSSLYRGCPNRFG